MGEGKNYHDQTETGEMDGNDSMQPEVLKVEDTQCGIGCARSSCIQPFAHMFLFVPAVSLASMMSAAFSLFLVTQVTTLEKQFGITSTESGLMLGANDVGYMLTVLLWSHFGKDIHKPRLLALCSFLFGLAGLVTTIPHFLMISEAGEMYANLKPSSDGSFSRGNLCLARNSTSQYDPSQAETSSYRIRRIAFAIFFLSLGVQGLIKSAKTPTLQTYIDDNVAKTKTGPYFGVVGALSLLGLILGSIVGGIFSRTYVTLEETDLTPRDPRWIGAWWLGFLIFASVALVVSIPLSLFPRRMPHASVKDVVPHPDMPAKSKASKDINAESSSSKKTIRKRKVLVVKAFFTSLLRICTNPVYVLLVLGQSILFLAIMGRSSFYAKYLEQYFRVPKGTSNFFIGLTLMIPLISSIAAGGFLSRRLRMTIRGSLIFKWITETMSAVLLFLSLIVICDQPTIYGLSNPSDGLKQISLGVTNMTCDTECLCVEQDFLPSCGADGHTYFSPCHAGCNDTLPRQKFGDCVCGPDSGSFNQTLTPGYCEEQCGSVAVYLVLTAVAAFIGGLDGVMIQLTQLRVVQERDRSLSLGLAGLLRSLLGFFLGPIVFGRIIDSACIVWSERGSCSLYDSDDFRIKMHVLQGGVLMGMVIWNAILVLLTFKMVRYRKIVEWQREAYIQEKKNSEEKKTKKSELNGGIQISNVKNGDIPISTIYNDTAENTKL